MVKYVVPNELITDIYLPFKWLIVKLRWYPCLASLTPNFNEIHAKFWRCISMIWSDKLLRYNANSGCVVVVASWWLVGWSFKLHIQITMLIYALNDYGIFDGFFWQYYLHRTIKLSKMDSSSWNHRFIENCVNGFCGFCFCVKLNSRSSFR